MQAFRKAVAIAQADIEALKKDINDGKVVAQFGARADSICNRVSPCLVMDGSS